MRERGQIFPKRAAGRNLCLQAVFPVAAAFWSSWTGPRKEAPGDFGQDKDARRIRVDACFLRVTQDPCAVSAKGVTLSCFLRSTAGRELLVCMGVPVGCNLTRRKDPQRTTAKVQHPILVCRRSTPLRRGCCKFHFFS